jgi:hypothetical protein
VFLDFGGLLGDALCNDEGHTAPDRIRLHPLEIAIPAHLLILGRFTVDADRAVGDNKADLPLAGKILKIMTAVILAYLFNIAFDLILSWFVRSDAQRSADKIADQYR